MILRQSLRRRSWIPAVVAALLVGIVADPAAADPVRERQWHLAALDVAAAHRITKGGGVTVGLVDTGVDAKHRDLSSAVLPGSDTFPRPTGDGRNDSDGHGTHMAGIIAGRGHGGGDGVLGIAPAAKILPVRTPLNTLTFADPIVAAIDYAVANGAKVINLAFSFIDEQVLRESIQRANAADVVLVASSGNKGDAGGGLFPAAYPGVLAVGAADRNGAVADLSVTGPQVDVVAPGVDIATTGINALEYYIGSGTSEATAVVSGAAALIRAKFPDLSAADVVHRITSTATDAGPKGRDDSYGHGRLDLMKALTAKVGPAPPQSTTTAPSTEVAAPTVPDDPESESLPIRQMMPLVLGIGAGLIVLLIGIVVLVVMMRRRRT